MHLIFLVLEDKLPGEIVRLTTPLHPLASKGSIQKSDTATFLKLEPGWYPEHTEQAWN
jgi:hypothetical protein